MYTQLYRDKNGSEPYVSQAYHAVAIKGKDVENILIDETAAVPKAIGIEMSRISAMVTGQVCVIAVSGSVISAVLTYLTAMAIPPAMPFYLKNENVAVVIAAFILISIGGGLISVSSISHVDPMEVIGGSGE